MSEKRDPLADYLRGSSGDPWAPGWGQVGYASYEEKRRRDKQRAEAEHNLNRPAATAPGGLIMLVALIALLLSGAQLAGFEIYQTIVRLGYLTRYADVPAVLICAAAVGILIVARRYGHVIDRIIVLGGIGLLAANGFGWLLTPWSDVMALIQ